MKCPGCGEFNEEGYAFCRSCGRALGKTGDADATVPLSAVQAEEATGSESEGQAAPPETLPPCRLVATAGLLAGRTFTLGSKGLMIGRDPANCQVVIADDEVSRLHAWVGYGDERELVVRDRGSSNGTYVNGVRVQEAVLNPKDEISVCSNRRHVFRLEFPGDEPPPAPPEGDVEVPEVKGVPSGTSFLDPSEMAAAEQEEQTKGGTVEIKLTDRMARPHLELIVDKYAVKRMDIPDSGLVLGRDPARCAVVMEHPSVSGVHAEFSPGDGKVALTDHSTNGTFVNGFRVKTAELQDGDYITFGRYAGKSLIFRTGLEPELKVENIELNKDRITIGRDASCDVSIEHPTVSKKHAEIVKQDGKIFVADLGSTNGTFVNGIKIKRHQLQPLDRIVIGSTELHFTGASLARSPGAAVVRLDVQNVTFQVRDRSTGQPRLLLDDISLVVKPRELIGLLGPSGAGKSTLMNALNGFVKPTGGQVLYNGVDLYRNLNQLKSTIGFVPQEDIMHKQLSVRRCLTYAAKLRLPEDVSDDEIDRRVREMLEILKIEPERWDNPVATLSGGQRKRVSIGIELLPKPGVLFLDEPTAGLDPRTETLMMMLFRQLANQGSTIIITTHLLASFGVLDKVVVMVQGRLAFYGPGTKFLDYFQAETPPDVYDDLTDNNTASYAQELKKRYHFSELHRELISGPLQTVEAERRRPSRAERLRPREFSLRQFGVLAARNWDLKFGDRAQTLLLLLQAPLVALLVALMASAPNQVQTLFMAMFAALWFGCSNSVREIVDEQTIYRRERQTGLKIPSYIFSKLLVLSVIALVQCVSVVAVLLFVNHALELSPQEILGAVAVLFLVALNGTLIGLVISALVRTPEKALGLFPLVLIPELLLSGLFMPVRKIQPVIPVTVEQLFEGKMFAQPEAKTKARQLLHPPRSAAMPTAAAPGATEATASAAPEGETTGTPPAAPGTPKAETGAPPESQPAAAQPAFPAASTEPQPGAAAGGEAAHQVVGAMAPSESVQKIFHKYTPAPVDGMPAPVRWLSTLAVSRWGLEALADLCLHGRHSVQDSAYKIINTVYISFHPDDLPKLEQGLEAPVEAFAQPGMFPLPSRYWQDQGPYLAVLAGFALVMVWIVLILMKRKDVA